MHNQIKKLSDRNVMNVQQKENTYQSFGQFNNFINKNSNQPTPAATYGQSI